MAVIKGDSSLRHIPVIIPTTSEDEKDISRSYELQANCFITKPVGLGEFTKIVQALNDSWFRVVKLPTGTKNGH